MRNKISVKQEKGVFPRFLVMPLRKNTRNLCKFIFFLFQEKIRPHGRLYGRLCRTRGFCVQRLCGLQYYLFSFQLFQQKRWSRGRFNCISTLACKGPVCVAVLTSFYGRFFVEVAINPKSFHLGRHFFICWLLLTLARSIVKASLPEVNKFTGNCFRVVSIVLKTTFGNKDIPANGLRLPLCAIMALGSTYSFLSGLCSEFLFSASVFKSKFRRKFGKTRLHFIDKTRLRIFSNTAAAGSCFVERMPAGTDLSSNIFYNVSKVKISFQ